MHLEKLVLWVRDGMAVKFLVVRINLLGYILKDSSDGYGGLGRFMDYLHIILVY